VDRPSNLVTYFFSNHLGTASATAYADKTITGQTDYYPFGGVAFSSGTDANHFRFTGKERDAETCNPSCLDSFGARHYSFTMGRFMTPDWASKPAAAPYAVFGNPRSLNLYSYVNNNPITTRDPDGHDALWVVDKTTGQTTLVIPAHFTGSDATPANISAITNRDNQPINSTLVVRQ
jgi:RHS repeat-associated protein